MVSFAEDKDEEDSCISHSEDNRTVHIELPEPYVLVLAAYVNEEGSLATEVSISSEELGLTVPHMMRHVIALMEEIQLCVAREKLKQEIIKETGTNRFANPN